jgi:hypothetical protein
VLGGGIVGDNLIHLSQFQRSGIILVIHAHHEAGLWLSPFHSSVIVITQDTLDLELSGPDAVGFVRVKFGLRYPTIGEFDRGNSLQLPPPPRSVPLS